MNQSPPADTGNTSQESAASMLANELVLLAIEHSSPATCSCGASWSLERALTVVGQAVATEDHPSE